ncbi:urease accessory protein UreF [Catenovulum sp. 2E275]|uniref:urease accessory protein UreF n=1 Tax=Catenovulum sp. 2E275 TaxID=2980497 RepID=UPI0021CE5418|nr:urease accessory UreF family protein [Catenovulum sp. 2E275]MCU4676945.1 urease accessory protein UreF [Catenovulum sp. 2E275]
MIEKKPLAALQLNRLLQLCSVGLPVGGFSFSQGLEYAIELGWVNNVTTTGQWIETNLIESIATTDLVVLAEQISILQANDFAEFEQLNQLIIACRESAELRLADLAMGKALIRLLNQQALDFGQALELASHWDEVSFISAFALACHYWQIDIDAALAGFCWTFIENQVAAATKLVPLGQTQAQNLLFSLSEKTQAAIEKAQQTGLDEIGSSLPQVAMASAWHETQYTRLFRS